MYSIAAYDACGSKRVGEFYDTSTGNCRRADVFFPKAGFIQILSSGKSGTPPCKSGQLEKDLGLEASSLRHAARLIIFEIMRSFFLGSKEQPIKLAALHWGKRADRSARSPSMLVGITPL